MPAGETSVVLLPVGNAGNAADASTGFGSVGYNYNIDEYDVTAAQYTAFLNAVAATDTYGLYNAFMSSTTGGYGNEACGISRSGSPGGYTYATMRNTNYPVNFVTWGDAARFCNWLTNGQPTGAEGNGTTETGSYTLNGATSNAALGAITRNSNADYAIPTENEWYKAAYYSPITSSYYLYPTQSNSQPSNVLSATGTNNANFIANGVLSDPTNVLTAVGAFADSPGPYGTYDQGGDLAQWNETIYPGPYRGMRGGASAGTYTGLQSGVFSFDAPSSQYPTIGFRVAQVPDPTSIGILAIGGMAMLSRRRGHRS